MDAAELAELAEILDLFGDNDSDLEDPDPDYVPVENHDISTDSEDPDDPEEPRFEPITRTRTRHFLEGATNEEVFNTSLEVLDFMAERRVDLSILLDVICWGDEASIANDRFRYARSTLLLSEAWPRILRRCRKPPGANTGRGLIRQQVMDEFVMESAGDLVAHDIKNIAKFMRPLDDPLSKESLTGTNLSDLADLIMSEKGAPHLTRLLQCAGWSKKQAAQNTHKTPKNVSIVVLSCLSLCLISYILF